MLSKNQQQSKLLFQEGYNLFISGGAGTGKSFLIKSFSKDYENPRDLVVTSTTGISALNVNGITIHSWAGIKSDMDLTKPQSYATQIKNSHKILNNYLYTKTLIIDEVSMLNPELFEFIDSIAKSVRQSSEPFGGIQIILIGDFYQLPPISNTNQLKFCFQSDIWEDTIDYSIILDRSYRQTDNNLVEFLNKVRVGSYDTSIIKNLEKYKTTPLTNKYTHLYPNKCDVYYLNTKKLNELSGETITNQAKIIYKTSSKMAGFPKDSTITENLMLKKGALVIINKNIDVKSGLVNGTQALFQSINGTGQALVEINNKTYTLSKQRWEFPSFYIEQYPICLAWALTIHKSQGMGIHYLSIDIGENIFNDGQAYVALSRAIDPNYLHIKNYDIGSIRSNKTVKRFYESIQNSQNQWYKEMDDNKTYYINSCTGITTFVLPENASIITKDTREISSETHEIETNPNTSLVCKLCEKGEADTNYKTWYGEIICIQCIMEDRDYTQLSKSELYDELNISRKKLDEVVKLCRNKPEKNACNPRFKRVPLYLLRHIKNHIGETVSVNKSSISTGKIKTLVETKPKPLVENKEAVVETKPKTMDEKISFTYNAYYKENKSIREISLALNYSKATIENYLFRAYIAKYSFTNEYLERLGYNPTIRQKIIDIVQEWKQENSENELPKLKYIKTEYSLASYLVIKLVLYMEYNIKT